MLNPGVSAPVRSPLETVARLGLVGIIAAGLAAELVYAQWPSVIGRPLFALLSLSFEGNLPTWYSSVLLVGCAAVCVAVARLAPTHRRSWVVLAWCLGYISFDEVAEIHENLGGHFGGEGILYFDWVIPASVAVVVLGALFLPLVLGLPRWLRNRVVLAGAIYVGGALLMELPLGYVAETRGVDNLAYGLIDWVEESMELCGATLFLLSAARYRAELAGAEA